MTANRRKNLAIALLTLAALAVATAISLNTDYYYFRNDGDIVNWHHPTGNFLIFCCFFVGEALFLAWAIELAPSRRLWKRSLLATLLFIPWTLFSSMFVVHAPGYMHFHILWVWTILVTLVLATTISAVTSIAAHSRTAA
ncbi:hypothetical protein [Thermomonas sp. HDW16]|uniref:hypothetical protein n=1 Tax=Thermomonas sp. HDW16 TaxID=2714945 RepID=UPI001409EA84|nr:hypothetical protein [Thermomonas sp. HDW16]QIL21087.1 hypothetical protein G7079_10310 [Thermomonas sp. HDW16]